MRSLVLCLLLALFEDIKANQRIAFSPIDVGVPIRHNPPIASGDAKPSFSDVLDDFGSLLDNLFLCLLWR